MEFDLLRQTLLSNLVRQGGTINSFYTMIEENPSFLPVNLNPQRQTLQRQTLTNNEVNNYFVERRQEENNEDRLGQSLQINWQLQGGLINSVNTMTEENSNYVCPQILLNNKVNNENRLGQNLQNWQFQDDSNNIPLPLITHNMAAPWPSTKATSASAAALSAPWETSENEKSNSDFVNKNRPINNDEIKEKLLQYIRNIRNYRKSTDIQFQVESLGRKYKQFENYFKDFNPDDNIDDNVDSIAKIMIKSAQDGKIFFTFSTIPGFSVYISKIKSNAESLSKLIFDNNIKTELVNGKVELSSNKGEKYIYIFIFVNGNGTTSFSRPFTVMSDRRYCEFLDKIINNNNSESHYYKKAIYDPKKEYKRYIYNLGPYEL
ncbi:hypothetical protein PIROE2DRAFT_16841 [Piromyces sp. E2]|nr:hypothetical protein PIROE2DRAFT_16841 [Piromyces sp. E2]|eukprot:OUM58011.1 hypothetical protein PIROE2DRAFT_16841 [Piromyces sp. E2]